MRMTNGEATGYTFGRRWRLPADYFRDPDGNKPNWIKVAQIRTKPARNRITQSTMLQQVCADPNSATNSACIVDTGGTTSMR
tara:strand:+ start:86663 stop:86908 length:246 start_codon:yes stop_codon:yes gene_type:complete